MALSGICVSRNNRCRERERERNVTEVPWLTTTRKRVEKGITSSRVHVCVWVCPYAVWGMKYAAFICASVFVTVDLKARVLRMRMRIVDRIVYGRIRDDLYSYSRSFKILEWKWELFALRDIRYGLHLWRYQIKYYWMKWVGRHHDEHIRRLCI